MLNRIFFVSYAIIQTHSWGGDGHAIITDIASSLVSDHGFRFLVRFLGDDLIAPSRWADTDEALLRYPGSNSYHFSHTPYRDCKPFVLERDCLHGSCIVTGLADAIQTSIHPNVSREERADALKFVLHLMADIHQPLHTGFREDDGGIHIPLNQPANMSLHDVWDYGLIDRATNDWRSFAANVLRSVRSCNGRFMDRIRSQTDIVNILSEEANTSILPNIRQYVANIASDTVTTSTCRLAYQDENGNFIGDMGRDNLSDEYFRSRIPVIKVQFAKAAVRLAQLIDAISAVYTGRFAAPIGARSNTMLADGPAVAVAVNDGRRHRRIVQVELAAVAPAPSYTTIDPAAAGSDLVSVWSSLGGPTLLSSARSNPRSCVDGYRSHPRSNCFALLMLASRMNREFVESIPELTQFIRDNVANLQRLLLEDGIRAAMDGQDGTVDIAIASFAADWISVFPEVFAITESQTATQVARFKGIVIRHRINRIMRQGATGGVHITPLSFRVNRAQAFAESAQGLLSLDVNRVRRGVQRAEFVGEEGRGPGIRRDWFSSVAAQVYSGDFGLFERSEAAPHYTRISNVSNGDDLSRLYYGAVGRFMAISLIEGVPLGVYFPRMFYRRLMDQVVELDDIQEDEPELYRSFSYILEMTAEELEIIDAPVVHSGHKDVVTLDNREAQVRAALQSLAINHREREFLALKDGFLEAIPVEVLNDIEPHEISDLIFGDAAISVDDLVAHVQLIGYVRGDSQIVDLIAVLREFSSEEMRKFLRFVTSNTQLPLGGFALLNPRLTVQPVPRRETVAQLPTSHTCSNLLDLPRYESRDELREKLLLAINTDSFGFI